MQAGHVHHVYVDRRSHDHVHHVYVDGRSHDHVHHVHVDGRSHDHVHHVHVDGRSHDHVHHVHVDGRSHDHVHHVHVDGRSHDHVHHVHVDRRSHDYVHHVHVDRRSHDQVHHVHVDRRSHDQVHHVHVEPDQIMFMLKPNKQWQIINNVKFIYKCKYTMFLIISPCMEMSRILDLHKLTWSVLFLQFYNNGVDNTPTDFHNICIACLRCLSAWCRFASDDLWNAVVCFLIPTTQFAYWKGLGSCDALLCVSHTLQSALESGQEARILQIDFSAAFDMVNHQGIQ